MAHDKFGAQNSKTFKFILAAIYHGGSARSKKSPVPCGTYTYNTVANDFIESKAVSQSISSSKIYKWIRRVIKTH